MEKLNSFGEEEFARIENEISQTAAELTEQISALGAQTTADISNLEESFGEQITVLAEQDEALRQKDTELADQIEDLSQRADTLDEQTTALAENNSKLAEEDTAIKERLAEVEKWIDDKDYGNGISITSFSHDAGTREMGSTIKSLNLNWGFDRKPVTQTLNGEALDVNVRSKHVDGLSITMDKSTWPTWKLTATDTRNKVVSSSVSSFTFLNGVYWGAAAQPEASDSSFVLGLTKRLSSGKVTSFTVNAGDGEYIWYCLPVRSPFGKCTFKVGGFEGGFTLVDTIDFTNDAENKYTEKYYIYRSDESGLGSTTVGVS
jgi:molybdopterin converting factor small subunit